MTKLGTKIKDVIRGDTRTVNLTFVQADGTTPIDLTGGTVYFTVQSTSDPADDVANLMFQKTATSFTDATHGKHTFTLTHSDTNITPGIYWYDAEFKDTAGNYLSAYRGEFIVQSDITRT